MPDLPGDGAPGVSVRLFAAAAEAVGANELSVEARTVAELRAALGASGASAASVIAQCAVLEGGIRRDDDHALAQGAAVDILPPFAGG